MKFALIRSSKASVTSQTVIAVLIDNLSKRVKIKS